MSPRRSARVGGAKLPDRIDHVVADARHAVLLDTRAKRDAKVATVDTKITTLFDLLPELRLRVYKYALQTEQPRNFKAPTIALVSKGMRAECLPVFFSECIFELEVVSTWSRRRELDAFARSGQLPGLMREPYAGETFHAALRRMAGRLELSGRRWLARAVREESVEPRFRHLEINTCTVRFAWMAYQRGARDAVFKISAPVATKSRPVVQLESAVSGTSKKDAQKMVETLQGVANGIADASERFVGFTVEDLEVLVRALKYWPDDE